MQKNVVIDSEADAWFHRNKDALLNRTDFSQLDTILKYVKKDELVLEIGSSFGYNLNYLSNKNQCIGYGVEPSSQAVEFGKKLYPNLNLRKGTIDEADIYDMKFDHIIIGFCFYLVDVELLPEVVFKIDKVLKKGGFLHVIDFDSKFPVQKSYSHDSRITTRKMDYSSLFCNFPNYFLVEKKSWSHHSSFFHDDVNERCSTVTLFKEF